MSNNNRTNNQPKSKTQYQTMSSELLEEFYGYEVPGYIVKAGKTFITIRVSGLDVDIDDAKPIKITIDDVVEYYRTQASYLSSGMRMIAGHYGDWRQIDALAQECMAWFKHVNVAQLRRQSRKVGLEPKF